MREAGGKFTKAGVEHAQRKRKATVVLLSLTVVLLACVQGMIVLFAHKDRARLAQIRELTRRIADERALEDPFLESDRLQTHSSAPARQAPPVSVEETQLRGRIRDAFPDTPAEGEIPPVGSPRAGLGHLVDLANFMAHERRASVVEWRGRLAILYQKIDPTAQDPLWEILNVLSDLKLIDGVTVVATERDLEKAKELKAALMEFGIGEERLHLGRNREHGEVFTGVLISTSAAI